MLLGVRPGFVDIYHTELVVMRESQRILRMDTKTLRSLAAVQSHIRWEIQRWQALQPPWGSPNSGARIEAEIKRLEEELAKYSSLTVHPTAYLPRGMIARIALRLLGGPAANYVDDVMCGYPACRQMSNLAALKSEHTPSG